MNFFKFVPESINCLRMMIMTDTIKRIGLRRTADDTGACPAEDRAAQLTIPAPALLRTAPHSKSADPQIITYCLINTLLFPLLCSQVCGKNHLFS